MTSSLHSRWVRRCELFALAAGLLVVAGGLFLLTAWFFDVEAVAKPRADWTPTNPTTALGFGLGGIALLLLRRRPVGGVKRGFAKLAAGLVLVLGAMALVDFALGWNLQVDPFAPREFSLRAEDPFPYLTSPATAVCFVLIGLALLIFDFRPYWMKWPAQILLMIAASVTLLAAAGYYYGPEDLHRVTLFTTITKPTVLSILLLCTGLLCSRPGRGFAATFTSERSGGYLMRRLLPIAVLAPLLLGWLRLSGERFGLYHFGFGVALFATSLILMFMGLIWRLAMELDRVDAERDRNYQDVQKANAKLQASEARYRLIVNNVKDFAVFTWNCKGRITAWNPGAKDLFGYTDSEVVKKPVDILNEDEHWGPPTKQDEGMAELDGEGAVRELWHVRKDGSRFFASEAVRPMRDEKGKLRGYLSVVKDITAQKKVEDELRRDMTFFRAVAETVPGMLFTWRADGHTVFACPNFYRLTGMPDGAAEGDGWLEAIHPEDRQATVATWRESLETGRPFDISHRIRMADGEYHWAITRARAVREEGEILRWFGFSTDIQEQKEIEEQLETTVAERTAELRERAEQLTRLASELTLTEQRERRRLAQILHDNLQQLLVGAKYGLNVLSGKLGKEERRYMHEVETLLDESISVSRSLTTELSPPILHDAGLFAGMEWLARWMKEKRGLRVNLHVDPRLVVEREDLRVLIFEAVRELLFNVAKHARVDWANVEIAKIEEGEELVAIVSDAGAGFESVQVFESAASVNAGFGLFNMRERLHLAGGRIEIESEPGKGSRVAITVPLVGEGAGSPEEASAAPPEESRGGGGQSRPGVADGHIRLLLVDDHAVVRQGLIFLLSAQEDLEVVGEAEDGVKALELAREIEPDVILMDFSMPRVDGVRATQMIHEEFPHIRIIGLSMFGEEDRAKAMLDAGASAYVSKSDKSSALLTVIREEARASAA